MLALTALAENSRYFLHYKLTELKLENHEDGRIGTALVNYDDRENGYTYFYIGTENTTLVYNQGVKEINIIDSLTTSLNSRIYYGICSNGANFIEKVFHKRTTRECICFYQVPQDHYEELMNRLKSVSYIPLELFRDSLMTLMDYKLTGVWEDSYEEGRVGAALVNIDSAKSCYAYYYNGAMMATPMYLDWNDAIEYVNSMDSSQTNNYFSQHGRIDYGRDLEGTYFVEKIFYERQQGLPQGIILYKIPEEYYDEILQRIVTLPSLPIDLFETSL